MKCSQDMYLWSKTAHMPFEFDKQWRNKGDPNDKTWLFAVIRHKPQDNCDDASNDFYIGRYLKTFFLRLYNAKRAS